MTRQELVAKVTKNKSLAQLALHISKLFWQDDERDNMAFTEEHVKVLRGELARHEKC